MRYSNKIFTSITLLLLCSCNFNQVVINSLDKGNYSISFDESVPTRLNEKIKSTFSIYEENSLEAKNNLNEFFLIMSSRAFNALNDTQKEKLSKYYKKIIHSDLTTIEKYGGGSARCMLNELF